jgi:hypothetical protein
MKVTKGNFPKGISKVIPATQKTKEKAKKFMSGEQRVKLTKQLAHFEATKNITI